MTIQEFNNLKVGDRVSIPDKDRKGQVISTEVLKIDRIFKKVEVLLGGNRFLSYRYVQKNSKKPWSCIVGSCNPYKPVM